MKGATQEGSPTRVAMVVFDGVQALDVAGPMDVFAEANHFLAVGQQYQVTLIGTHAGSVRCANGMELRIRTDYTRYEDEPDLLLVTGGPKLPDVAGLATFRVCLQWCLPTRASRTPGSQGGHGTLAPCGSAGLAISRSTRSSRQDLRLRRHPIHVRGSDGRNRPVSGSRHGSLGP